MPALSALAAPPRIAVRTVVGGCFVVRPAPRREPPFDDERPTRHLSLVDPLDPRLPFDDERTRRITRPEPMSAAELSGPPDDGSEQLPDVLTFSRRLVVGIIETAVGRRSVGQLDAHTSPAVRAGLARDSGRITRLGTAERPASLHSVHISETADGVAEVAAIVLVGTRYRALAFRLEGQDGRWRCVRLQIG